MKSTLMLNESENNKLNQILGTLRDVSAHSLEKKVAYASPCPCGGTCAGECTGAGCTGTFDGCHFFSG